MHRCVPAFPTSYPRLWRTVPPPDLFSAHNRLTLSASEGSTWLPHPSLHLSVPPEARCFSAFVFVTEAISPLLLLRAWTLGWKKRQKQPISPANAGTDLSSLYRLNQLISNYIDIWKHTHDTCVQTYLPPMCYKIPYIMHCRAQAKMFSAGAISQEGSGAVFPLSSQCLASR